jgi:hypothetical protein
LDALGRSAIGFPNYRMLFIANEVRRFQQRQITVSICCALLSIERPILALILVLSGKWLGMVQCQHGHASNCISPSKHRMHIRIRRVAGYGAQLVLEFQYSVYSLMLEQWIIVHHVIVLDSCR